MSNVQNLVEHTNQRWAPFTPMHAIGGNDVRYIDHYRKPFIPSYSAYDNLQQYNSVSNERPHAIHHGNDDSQDHGVISAPSPPQQIRDVIFTHQYASGQFGSRRHDMQKAATILHTLENPVTGQKTFSWVSAKGGQLEGY